MDGKIGSTRGTSSASGTFGATEKPPAPKTAATSVPRPSFLDRLGTKLNLRKASVVSAAASRPRAPLEELPKKQQEHVSRTFARVHEAIRDTDDPVAAQKVLVNGLIELALMDKTQEEQEHEGGTCMNRQQAEAVARVMKAQVPTIAQASGQRAEVAKALWCALVSRAAKDSSTLIPVLNLVSDFRAVKSQQHPLLVQALATTLEGEFAKRFESPAEARNAGFGCLTAALEEACSAGAGMNHARTQSLLDVADALKPTLSDIQIVIFEDTLKTLNLPPGSASLERAEAFLKKQGKGGAAAEVSVADRKAGPRATASPTKVGQFPKFGLPAPYALLRLPTIQAQRGHSAMLLRDAIADQLPAELLAQVWTEVQAELGRDPAHLAPLFDHLYAAGPGDAGAKAIWSALRREFTRDREATQLGRTVVFWELARLASAHNRAIEGAQSGPDQGPALPAAEIMARYSALTTLSDAVFSNMGAEGGDDVALHLAAVVASSARGGFTTWSAWDPLKAAIDKHPAMKHASGRAMQALELLVPKGALYEAASQAMQSRFPRLMKAPSAQVDADTVERW